MLPYLLLACFCGTFSPANGQSVQSMSLNQPFPYAKGTAMDAMQYELIKAKLQAADELKVSSAMRISSLQAEVSGFQTALTHQQTLGQYDNHAVDSLRTVLANRRTELETAQAGLEQAVSAQARLLAVLPRAVRSGLINAPPDEQASAILAYIHVLQARKWKWAGLSVLIGSLGTSLFLLLR